MTKDDLQDSVTLVHRCPPFKVLKMTFLVSRRAEQFRLCVKERVVTTVEESVLREEMENFESQEEDTLERVIWYTPMTWMDRLGLITEMSPGLTVCLLTSK